MSCRVDGRAAAAGTWSPSLGSKPGDAGMPQSAQIQTNDSVYHQLAAIAPLHKPTFYGSLSESRTVTTTLNM